MPHHCFSKENVDKGVNIYQNLYQDTTGGQFNTSIRLLMHWKGTFFKLILDTFVTWIVLYGILSIIYHNTDPGSKSRQTFELMCIYANKNGSRIPLSFLIGFYVSQVLSRWWAQFMALPYPDFLAIKLVNFVPGTVRTQEF